MMRWYIWNVCLLTQGSAFQTSPQGSPDVHVLTVRNVQMPLSVGIFIFFDVHQLLIALPVECDALEQMDMKLCLMRDRQEGIKPSTCTGLHSSGTVFSGLMELPPILLK